MAYVCWWNDWVTISGSTIAKSSARPATSCGIRRTHQISRSRSGTAGTRGANEKLSAPVSSRRLIRATRNSTRIRTTNCTSPTVFGKLNTSTWYRIPMPIAPDHRRGNDFIPPMRAADRPSNRVSGPIVTRSEDPCSVA